MGRIKPGKPHRRSAEKRIDARENRSSAAYLIRLMSEVETEKAKSDAPQGKPKSKKQ
jgi:hypothetical protein